MRAQRGEHATAILACLLACLLVIGYGGCSLGSGPGRPYDFTQLEPIIEPLLSSPELDLLDRREVGSDCDGFGCQRPLLSYRFRSSVAVTCDLIQRVLATFHDITVPFSPTGLKPCAYIGEVQGHVVTVGIVEVRIGTLIPRSHDHDLEAVQIAIGAGMR